MAGLQLDVRKNLFWLFARLSDERGASHYHWSRAPNCVVLALLPEFRNERMPFAPGAWLFGWLKTLKKSTLTPKHDSLVEIDELLRGCVLAPRPRSNYELIPPRVQVVVEVRLLDSPVVQGHPHGVGIPEIGDIRIRGSICRKGRLPPRNQRSIRRLVIVRHAHNAVRLAIGVACIDPVGRNVGVPIQVARETVAAGAILDRIFEAVDLKGIVRGIVDLVRQAPPPLPEVAEAGNLPATDQRVHPSLANCRKGASPFRTAIRR